MPNNGTVVTTEVQPTLSNPLDIVPNEIPFDAPYGLPISLDRAHWPIWTKPEQRLGSCAFALFGASRLGFHEFLRTLLKRGSPKPARNHRN
jgi:hypothetical protein